MCFVEQSAYDIRQFNYLPAAFYIIWFIPDAFVVLLFIQHAGSLLDAFKG